MKPTPAKPRIIIAHFEGSGTAAVTLSDTSSKYCEATPRAGRRDASFGVIVHVRETQTSGSPTGYPLLGSPTATICFGNHVLGQRAIGGDPRIRHFRCPSIPQALLQRPKQRGADRRIVPRLRTVADMPLCQCAGGRQNLFEIAKTFHHPSQHCHQLSALLDHIAGKHCPRLRGDMEQTIIKQHGHGFRSQCNLSKTALNQCDLFWRHCNSPSVRFPAADRRPNWAGCATARFQSRKKWLRL